MIIVAADINRLEEPGYSDFVMAKHYEGQISELKSQIRAYS